MTISEIIAELENLKSHIGDVDVLDGDGYLMIDVREISFEDGNEEWQMKPGEKVAQIVSGR